MRQEPLYCNLTFLSVFRHTNHCLPFQLTPCFFQLLQPPPATRTLERMWDDKAE